MENQSIPTRVIFLVGISQNRSISSCVILQAGARDPLQTTVEFGGAVSKRETANFRVLILLHKFKSRRKKYSRRELEKWKIEDTLLSLVCLFTQWLRSDGQQPPYETRSRRDAEYHFFLSLHACLRLPPQLQVPRGSSSLSLLHSSFPLLLPFPSSCPKP